MSLKQRVKLAGSSHISFFLACLEMARHQSTCSENLDKVDWSSAVSMNICLWQVVSRLFYIISLLQFFFFSWFQLPHCFFSGEFETLCLWAQFCSGWGELESKIPWIRRGGVVRQYCAATAARPVPTWKVWALGLGWLTRPADVGWPSICCIHCV